MPDPKLLAMLDDIETDYPAEEYPEVAEATEALQGAIEEAGGDMDEAPEEELDFDDEELDMAEEGEEGPPMPDFGGELDLMDDEEEEEEY